MPVLVHGAVQWSLAKQQAGNRSWLVHLANNEGVLKPRNESQTLLPAATRTADIRAKINVSVARDWVTGSELSPVACAASTDSALCCFRVTLGPGAAAVVELR